MGGLSIIWSAIVAATSFVADLVAAVVAWGLSALHQIASVLKQVAGAILWALDQVLSFLVTLATGLLKVITQGISNLMSGYTHTIWSDILPLWSAFNSTQTLASSALANFMNDLFGSPFLIALTLSTVVAIVLVVIDCLSLGAGFVSNLILSLVTSAVSTIAVWALSSLIPVSLISSSMVSAVWWIYNATGDGLHSLLVAPAGALCPNIIGLLLNIAGSWVSTIAVKGDLRFGVNYAYGLSKFAFSGINPWYYALPILSFAMDVASLFLSAAGFAVHGYLGYILNWLGLFLGLGGLIGAGYLLLEQPKFLDKWPGLYKQVYGGLGLGIVGVGISAYQIGAGCS